MASDNLGELRERLLRDAGVQKMIRIRAYEIYQMRGGQPGGEAQDWFQAESEVLAFLIADASSRADESKAQQSRPVTTKPDIAPEGTTKRSKARASKPRAADRQTSKKTAAKRDSNKPAPSKSKPKRTRKEPKA